MEGNFNINLPSIPSRVLKFKIQDVRMKGFSTREGRFKDNKEYLTRRFINSFANLQPKPPPQPESKVETATTLSSCFHEQQDNFRWMVADDKKNLLIKYEDHYKSYHPPLAPLDPGRSYSFPRQGADSLDELTAYHSQLLPDAATDNYYFNMTEQSDEESDDGRERRRVLAIEKKKQVQPTAAFKSEDRWQEKERELRHKIKVGPGSYALQTIKHSPPKEKKVENPEEPPIQKLKELLKDYRTFEPLPHAQQKKKEVVHNSSYFAEANVDRFGNQKYPTLVRTNVPGPGSYDTHGSLEEKAKKILIVEEQRKLLREWYNDDQ